MKRDDESYIDYKKRTMDPISSSFCAAKWLNATIWLGNGATVSCHHPRAHRANLDDVLKDPSALHNTHEKKVARGQMLTGVRPDECDYCWRVEDMRRDNVSDRIFKTAIYSDEDINRIKNLDSKENVVPRTLEIAFDRICNFGCSYCNATFSTRWARDMLSNGFYKGLETEDAFAYQHEGLEAQPYQPGETNPFVEAFFKWWPRLSRDLQELRVTGGEPLMSSDVWRLFEFFKTNKLENLRFSLNSNLGSKDELIDKLIEATHSIEHFDLYTSCESYGAHAEYIRDGLEFDQWVANIQKIITRGKLKSLNMMMTVNSLCLFSITELLDLMLQWKEAYGFNFPIWSVNILKFPSFMSPLILPDHIKKERCEHLKNWFSKNENHRLMTGFERESIKRLIDYLEAAERPLRVESTMSAHRRDFKRFYQQYDQRRGKDIRKVFPSILTEWIDSIQA